jgi:glycosyltransferase involved in cell wall biosynthesis
MERLHTLMKRPEVSIIVPIYNGSAYLSETLNALLSQTFGDFELLAIDDGSTDNSSTIVRSFDDPRIRLIEKKNGGLCDALNRGIAEASAPWIARCDQDDISFPERLERQFQMMKDHPESIGLFSYTTKFGSKHGWSNADKVVMAPGELKVFQPMEDGCLLGSTMLMRTATLRSIGGFRQEYYPSDDWDLELRLAQVGRVLVMREPMIAYRFHTSANTYRTFADMCEKRRWAEDSYWRRQEAISELTFEEFKLAQPRDVWTRLRRYRKDSSKLHMRTAGQEYLDGRYLASAGHLVLSAMLHPAEITRRVRRYVSRS